MTTRRQTGEAMHLVGCQNFGIRLHLKGLLSVDSIGYIAVNFLARSIPAAEAHRLQLPLQHLLGQVNVKGRRTGTDGYRHASITAFSSLVGHVSLYHEVIEACLPTVGILQNQRHGYFESPLAIGLKFTISHFAGIFLFSPPPEGTAALYLIFHLGALNGNTSITLGYATYH